MKLVKYTEGACFAVPLRQGGFAVGVVSRASADGPIVFAHFFGPLRESLPSLSDAGALAPAEAVLAVRTSDMNLKNGKWPLLGVLSGWDRAEWAMPEFLMTNPLNKTSSIVRYADDDPGKTVSVEKVPHGTSSLSMDAVLGVGVVETRLTKRLTAVS